MMKLSVFTDPEAVTGEKLHSIHVRLDEARYQELKVYAARNSKNVQTILSEYIDTLTRQKVNEKSEIREQAKAALKRISPAQRKVFDAMLEGGDAPAIAARVGVTPSTVSSHIVAILKEFGVSSRIDLLAMFVVPPPRFKGRPHKYNRKSVGQRDEEARGSN